MVCNFAPKLLWDNQVGHSQRLDWLGCLQLRFLQRRYTLPDTEASSHNLEDFIISYADLVQGTL